MVEVQAQHTHPIVKVLHDRGSTVTWLARRIKKNRTHTSLVVHGRRQGSEDFWRACAAALGVPEGDLFHASPTNEPAAEAVA